MAFSFKRIWIAMFRDVALLKNTIITTLAVASGILFLGLFLMTRRDDYLSADEFMGIFGLCYVVSGMLFTFGLLKESHNQKYNHLYLALPISTLERLTAIWLTTTVVYTIAFTLVALIVGQLAILLGGIVFGSNFHLVALFSDSYGQLIKGYFITQPIFLCGAIAFSTNRIGKTLLTLLVVFIGILFYGLILFSILNYRHGVYPGDLIGEEAFNLASKDFSEIGTLFFTLLFGPVMLLVAYFKILEKEV